MRQNAFADWTSDPDLEKLISFFSKHQCWQAGIVICWLYPILANDKAQSELHDWLEQPERSWRTHSLTSGRMGEFFQHIASIAFKGGLPADAPKDVRNVCISLSTGLLTEGAPELLSLLTDAGASVKSPAIAYLIYLLREICERTIEASERFMALEKGLAKGNPGLN
jgi:hypothetical protein